jgi:hypothetical protein
MSALRWTLILRTACGATSSVAWNGDRPPRDHRVPIMPSRRFVSLSDDVDHGDHIVQVRVFEIDRLGRVDEGHAVAWYNEVVR